MGKIFKISAILIFVFLFSLIASSSVFAASFDDIQDEIDSDTSTINLGTDTYNSDSINTIRVNKSNVVIKGSSVSSKAVLDGQSSGFRIMVVSGSNVRLENLIFKNFYANNLAGALVSTGSNLTVINCEFINNKGLIGGIYLQNSSNGYLIQNCTFINNSAAYFSPTAGGSSGGAIDIHSSNGQVVNSVFNGNSAIGGGGAIFYFSGTNNTINNCIFDGNNASSAGAIYMVTSNTILTISNCVFRNNKATDNGGAIHSNITLKIDNTTFINNFANYGGAIFNTGTLNIISSNFSNNKATSRISITVPSFVNCSNIAVIKATLVGGNNIKDAIYSDKNIQFDRASIGPKNTISNQNIVLTVNGKTFNNKTNNQGIATFNINTKGFSIKKHNGVAKFSGTGGHVQNSSNFILNVVTKKVTQSALKDIKTYKTKIQYQARINVYTNTKVNYQTLYYKPISGDMIQYYKTNKGTKTVPVFKNYMWKNISKGSSVYKWYMQRYYKIYYKKAINNTKTWLNGEYKGLTKKSVKYTTNSSTKYVPGKTKDFSMYVLPSIDCESDDPQIKTLAKKLIKGKKTDIQKANSILKYVQNKIKYPKPAYGNTRKGAVGTETSKIGNCVDSTHLTIALLRAANIPAKYEAKYVSKLKSGHAWPLVYLKVGKSYQWVEGEATGDEFVAFGKDPFTKKWRNYTADKGSYINLYKYSKKYIHDNNLKQWVAIEEYHYINGKWLTYYVLSGNADRTFSNLPAITNKIKLNTIGVNS